MADQYTYPKKRKEFGRHAQFEDSDTKIVGSIMPNSQQRDLYLLRDPNKLILDNIPQFSDHRVSTNLNTESITSISFAPFQPVLIAIIGQH